MYTLFIILKKQRRTFYIPAFFSFILILDQSWCKIPVYTEPAGGLGFAASV